MIALSAVAVLSSAVSTAASFQGNPQVEAFVDELVATHNFDRRQLTSWFSRATLQRGVVRAMLRPGTARPWDEYRASQVSAARIRAGLAYWQTHAQALTRAHAASGVPQEIIVATIGIETFYGRTLGNHFVFDALATLAFSYPPRAQFFREELTQLLLLARELGGDPSTYKGSYAGALGVAQFLPGSYRRYAIDFDENGKRDLWNHDDAIGSIANYYQSYGWRPGERVVVTLASNGEQLSEEFKLLLEAGILPHTTPVAVQSAGLVPVEAVADDIPVSVFATPTAAGPIYWMGLQNFYVITRYNRSVNYALAVHDLAVALRQGREEGRFK